MNMVYYINFTIHDRGHDASHNQLHVPCTVNLDDSTAELTWGLITAAWDISGRCSESKPIAELSMTRKLMVYCSELPVSTIFWFRHPRLNKATSTPTILVSSYSPLQRGSLVTCISQFSCSMCDPRLIAMNIPNTDLEDRRAQMIVIDTTTAY